MKMRNKRGGEKLGEGSFGSVITLFDKNETTNTYEISKEFISHLFYLNNLLIKLPIPTEIKISELYINSDYDTSPPEKFNFEVYDLIENKYFDQSYTNNQISTNMNDIILKDFFNNKYDIEKSINNANIESNLITELITLKNPMLLKKTPIYIVDNRYVIKNLYLTNTLKSPNRYLFPIFRQMNGSLLDNVLSDSPMFNRLKQLNSENKLFNFHKLIDTLFDFLEDLHAKKLIHNDIKPENVLYKFKSESDPNLDFYITDFGLMTTVEDFEKPPCNRTCGTRLYFSPHNISDLSEGISSVRSKSEPDKTIFKQDTFYYNLEYIHKTYLDLELNDKINLRRLSDLIYKNFMEYSHDLIPKLRDVYAALLTLYELTLILLTKSDDYSAPGSFYKLDEANSTKIIQDFKNLIFNDILPYPKSWIKNNTINYDKIKDLLKTGSIITDPLYKFSETKKFVNSDKNSFANKAAKASNQKLLRIIKRRQGYEKDLQKYFSEEKKISLVELQTVFPSAESPFLKRIEQAAQAAKLAASKTRSNQVSPTSPIFPTPPSGQVPSSQRSPLSRRIGDSRPPGPPGQPGGSMSYKISIDRSTKRKYVRKSNKKWFLDENRGKYRFTDEEHKFILIKNSKK
jgi:serine/threonine protein kinase